MHGYAIIDYVRLTSSGQFDYAEGTIYPALRQLEDDGLVRSRWDGTDGRRRRVYAITAQGKKSLAGRCREWELFTKGVQAVLEHG